MKIQDIKTKQCCFFCKFWYSNTKNDCIDDNHGVCCWTKQIKFIPLPGWLKETTRFTMGCHGENCNAFTEKTIKEFK